jgi:hypothetical protein
MWATGLLALLFGWIVHLPTHQPSTALEDPAYSCHMLPNGSWACRLDVELRSEYDPEDSY